MCSQGCKHWIVSTEIIQGQVIQTCKDCGKQMQIPGSMFAVVDWMLANVNSRPEFKKQVHFIEAKYSKIL